MRVWEKPEPPYIESHGQVMPDGTENIRVQLGTLMIDDDDLVDGGLTLEFEMNHPKQTTEVYRYTYFHGAVHFESKPIKRYKGEIWVEADCLRFAREYMEQYPDKSWPAIDWRPYG